MASSNDRDEPGPSRQSRRHRRGSLTSSGRYGVDECDDKGVPSQRSRMKELVEIGRGFKGLFDIKISRAFPLLPNQRNPRSPSEFRYKPLRKGQIRMLRVMADNKQASVRCEMDHMSLQRPRPYIALSYAWGDKYNTTEIELNRGVFSITSSLYGALRAIREPDRDVLVWADAVCINQKDADERSEQVQKMYLIYREADFVGIWLGPEADDSSRAIALIEKLSEEGLDQEDVKRIIYSSSWDRHFHALVDLFERDYWDRLWVVQEVNNAERGVVYCGDNRTPWDEFINVSKILSPCEDDLQRRFKRVTRRNRSFYKTWLIGHGPMNLIPVGDASLVRYLNYFRSRLASDARDKLYGLLGILPAPVQQRFKPDYEFSPSELYIDIVQYVLETTGCMDIICSTPGLSGQPKLLKLPSWVPDWSQSMSFFPIYENSSFCFGSLFCASGSVYGQFELVGNTRSKLRMRAIHLGSVRASGVVLPELTSHLEVVMALINWWYTFIQFPTKGPDSFCRTITLGQINSREWRSVCLHIIGVLAACYIPDLQLHRDLQPNATIQIQLEEAREIVDRSIIHRVAQQSFFVTDRNDIGLARGAIGRGRVVCIPLGVSITDHRLHMRKSVLVG